MKKLIILAAALLSPTLASANPDLQYALSSLNQAKIYISQGQSHRATDAILSAESSIFRAMGNNGGGHHRRKAYVCAFTYQGQQVSGRGDSDEEARRDLTVNCMRSHPAWTSVCQTFATNPYTTTCVERAN